MMFRFSQALMDETGAARDVPFDVNHDSIARPVIVRRVGPFLLLFFYTFPSNLC